MLLCVCVCVCVVLILWHFYSLGLCIKVDNSYLHLCIKGDNVDKQRMRVDGRPCLFELATEGLWFISPTNFYFYFLFVATKSHSFNVLSPLVFTQRVKHDYFVHDVDLCLL